MCIALCSPNGIRPTESIIDDCYASNSHGAGIAWAVGNKVRWKKGLDLPGIKAALAAIPLTTPFVMHFRITSVGPTCPELTHPFPIDMESSVENEGEANSVLFQNGTYGSWEDKLLAAVVHKGTELPPPPWSDSRALAVVCAAYGSNILYMLGNSSRFCVFTAGATPDKRSMKLIGDWTERDGIHYSNKYCEPFVTRHTANTTFTQGGSAANTTTSPTTPSTAVTHSVQSSGTNGSNGRPLVRTSSNQPRHIGPPATSPFNVWEPFDQSGREVRNQS